MKKQLKYIVLLLGVFLVCGGIFFYHVRQDTCTVALVPLDSRPCNTQYVQTLGEMANMRVILPPEELLDDYLTPADREGLWQWLEKNAQKCDHIIIATNELLQGGLINSRDSSSFADLAADCERLRAFCQRHAEKDIIILTVLPRLLPSQYDSELAPYMQELAQYGIAWDQAALNGEPLPECSVPDAVLDKYRSLFTRSGEFLRQLRQMADDDLCRLVVGQDDGAEFCPANILKRELLREPSPNVAFLHGADELSMLILASLVDLPPSTLQVVIDDESAWAKYFPYEAADLAAVLAEKLAFANVVLAAGADDVLFIHADASSVEQTADFLYTAADGYKALADIAYTNRGDKALAEMLLDDEVFASLSAYSGWNTAGNTLGTVIAHYRLSQVFDGSKKAAQAALSFKAIRFSEDLVYQALLSNDLRLSLAAQNQMSSSTTAFSTDTAAVEPILDAAFAPYGERLEALFGGRQTILPGYTADVSSCKLSVSFPWARAFEIKCESEFVLAP